MKRPEHLAVYSGDLHDHRRPDWASNPIRRKYAYTFGRIRTAQQVAACLRNGQYAWPGGDPLFFITRDGAALCFECVRKEWRQVVYDFLHNCSTGWRVEACDVNYESNDLFCDHCSEQIESADGDDTEKGE